MKRLFSFLFWCLAFLLIAVGLDQLFVRVEMRQPVLVEIRTFYVDFRARLLHLAAELPTIDGPATKKPLLPRMPKVSSTGTKPPEVIDGRQPKPLVTLPAPAVSVSNPQYLYSDDKGNLLFVDRIEDIPDIYRSAAQPLSR